MRTPKTTSQKTLDWMRTQRRLERKKKAAAIPSVDPLCNYMPDEAIRSLQLRIPDSLHEALKQAAHDGFRSLNGEIIWRLKQSLKGGET